MKKLVLLLSCFMFSLTVNLKAQAFDCPTVDYRNNGNTANFIPAAYYYTNSGMVIPTASTISGKITLKFTSNPTIIPFITGVFVGTTTYTCVVGPPSTVSISGGFWLVSYGVYNGNLPPNNSSYNLQFSNPNSTTVANVTGAGSVLKVCSYSSTGTLLAVPVISAQPVNVNECQNQTITFSVTAAAQNGGTLSYQWRKNGTSLTNGGRISGATTTTLTITNTALTDAGNYDVLISETGTNKATTGAFTISSAGTLVIYETFNAGSIATTGETICYNGNPSTINNAAVATGGNLNYSYQWEESTNNGVSYTAISGATSSSYTPPSGLTQTKIFRRTAKDGRCQTTFTPSTGTWKVTVPTAPISATSAKTSYNGSDLSCSNATDGRITVTASGSYGNYQYSNDNGSNWQTSNVFSSLAAGSYTILVKDNNNCQTSTSKTLTAPSQVTITATATQILCYGGTGSVTLTSNGGTGTLTYGTTATTSLTADTYNYTVTDANGCSANTSAVINAAPSQVTITATATQILCYGGTGSVAITSNGGTGTLTYGTTATTSLTAGTYNYTVADANGCSANTSVVINAAPSQVTVTATTSTNASCINATDGAIGLTVTGGTLAYTYLWSNNAVTKDITGLAIGNYSVTVTDHNGCTANANASVILYDVIKPVVITKNISIDLDATGNVTITASQVNNGSNDACGIASMTLDKSTFNCSNKGNNTVVLTVTDVNGNVEIGNATVTINDVTNPIALCKAVTKVLSNGMATIALSDIDNGSSDACGIASRTLSKTSFNCSNIGSNTVTLTVTDMNGNVSTCTSNVTITGSVPTISLTSAPNNANNVIGSTNTLAGVNQMFLGYGAQSMNLSCIGAGPLTYNWSGSGLNSNTIANPVFTPTTGGNKTLTCTVTNLNGCQTSSNIVICVMDIRSSGGSPSNPKVNICHLPPGNVANVQTLSVSISAVPAHIGLHGGDRLGACAQSCGSQKSGEIGEIYTDGNADLIVYPNPSASTFSFRLETSSNEPITINVFDINGRLVSNTEYSNASEMMLIGDNLANGMYFAQVKQGEFNKTVRIQKIY